MELQEFINPIILQTKVKYNYILSFNASVLVAVPWLWADEQLFRWQWLHLAEPSQVDNNEGDRLEEAGLEPSPWITSQPTISILPT